MDQIQLGCKLAVLEEVDPHVEFNRVMEENPNAKIMQHSTLKDGSVLCVIVKDENVISKIAVNIYKDEKCVQKHRYVFLQ